MWGSCRAGWYERLMPGGGVSGVLRHGRALPAVDASACDPLQVLHGWVARGEGAARPMRYGGDVRLVRCVGGGAGRGTPDATPDTVPDTALDTAPTSGHHSGGSVTEHYMEAGAPVTLSDCQAAFQVRVSSNNSHPPAWHVLHHWPGCVSNQCAVVIHQSAVSVLCCVGPGGIHGVSQQSGQPPPRHPPPAVVPGEVPGRVTRRQPVPHSSR